LLKTQPGLADLRAARAALDKQRRDARFAALLAEVRKDVEVRLVWQP